MTYLVEVYGHCPGCGGTGRFTGRGINPVDEECTQCGGDGELTIGWFDGTALKNKLNSIEGKCDDILDAVSG